MNVEKGAGDNFTGAPYLTFSNRRTRMTKGSISINRVSGGEGEYIRVELIDESSGTHFLEAKLSLEDFAKALFGLSQVDCSFELRPAYVGWQREVKQENVNVPSSISYRLTDEEISAALMPHEVDGWKAYRKDAGNHHKEVGPGIYNVTFFRYVYAGAQSVLPNIKIHRAAPNRAA